MHEFLLRALSVSVGRCHGGASTAEGLKPAQIEGSRVTGHPRRNLQQARPAGAGRGGGGASAGPYAAGRAVQTARKGILTQACLPLAQPDPQPCRRLGDWWGEHWMQLTTYESQLCLCPQMRGRHAVTLPVYEPKGLEWIIAKPLSV